MSFKHDSVYKQLVTTFFFQYYRMNFFSPELKKHVFEVFNDTSNPAQKIESKYSLLLLGSIRDIFPLLHSCWPPTKLREDNGFTRICLFTGGGETPCYHYPRCIGPHCIAPPPVPVLPPPARPLAPTLDYWHLTTIPGDLFKLVHLRTHPPLVLISGGWDM